MVHICQLDFGKTTVRVDFGYYPFKQVEPGIKFKNIKVDSLLDIAINKIQTISQRLEVKDFVDLYFLLQKFSLWDLREGVRIKFGIDLEPLLLASDLLLIDNFEQLPRMIVPLKLTELKSFFREKAKTLGRMAVE